MRSRSIFLNYRSGVTHFPVEIAHHCHEAEDELKCHVQDDHFQDARVKDVSAPVFPSPRVSISKCGSTLICFFVENVLTTKVSFHYFRVVFRVLKCLKIDRRIRRVKCVHWRMVVHNVHILKTTVFRNNASAATITDTRAKTVTNQDTSPQRTSSQTKPICSKLQCEMFIELQRQHLNL